MLWNANPKKVQTSRTKQTVLPSRGRKLFYRIVASRQVFLRPELCSVWWLLRWLQGGFTRMSYFRGLKCRARNDQVSAKEVSFWPFSWHFYKTSLHTETCAWIQPGLDFRDLGELNGENGGQNQENITFLDDNEFFLWVLSTEQISSQKISQILSHGCNCPLLNFENKHDRTSFGGTVVVRYMADRLYGGLRIWRTIFAVFERFLTIFGDFEQFFRKYRIFPKKKSVFWPKNPESTI